MAYSFVILFMLTAVRIMGIDASIYSLDILLVITEMFGWINSLVLLYFVRLHALLLVSYQKKINSNKIMVKLNYWGHRYALVLLTLQG